MQIRCYRCGTPFALKREEIAFALQALQQSDGTHYDARCPRCRTTNRVSRERLEQAAPPPAPPDPAEHAG